MKNFLTLMAIATTITASASVSTVEKKVVVAEKMNTAAQMLDYSRVENNNGMLKAPAKVDLNNYYGFTYYGRTKEDGQSLQTTAIQLKQVSETKVLIYGLFYPVIDYPVEATYDASKMTLTIKPQVVVPAEEWFELTEKHNESLNLYCRELEVTDNTITGEKELPSITFQYGPEGFQMQDGSIRYVGAWVPESNFQELVFNIESNLSGTSGWLGSWKYGMMFTALEDLYPAAPAFSFDPSEWTNVGNSKFTDGWFSPIVEGGETPAYDVVTYVNNENKNLYLLENPYGANSPYSSINATPNEKGYIMLNVENPECVLVRPNIPSGMVIEDIFKSTLTCTTDEGMRFYIDEYTYEDIIDEAQSFEVPLPTMSKDFVVTLPNCGFQYISYLVGADKWADESGETAKMVSTIALPSAGVEGIINDTENVAKRFFNLQGVEIANPEAGQVVIVKQGNKTSKTIIR